MPGPGPVAGGPGSVALGGDAVDSVIVTGDGNHIVKVDLGGIDGDLLNLLLKRDAPTKRPRPPPVLLRPPPYADHLDRDDEAATILGTTRPGAPVNVYGETGIGKTFLLTHVANRPPTDRFPGGVVHLSGRGVARQDLLQGLFDRLFECQPPVVQSEGQTEVDLQDREVMVIVDDLELDGDDAQRLFAAAPRCGFVVSSATRTVWNGTALRLEGLDPADSAAIFERELGPLVGAEQGAAQAVAAALDHNALAIRQAASLARDERIPLAELAGWLAGAPSGRAALVGRALGATGPEERAVLSTLAVFGAAPVGTEHLAAIAGPSDVDATLAQLERRRLVCAHSPRYSLRGLSADDIEGRWPADVAAGADRALEHFTTWVAGMRADLAGLLVQSDALVALQRSAAGRGRRAEAIAIGRGLSATLAWGRRWDQWRQVLETVLDSARSRENRRDEAWALHQLGTRAVALGQLPQGIALLQEALSLRETTSRGSEVELTRHNLEVARSLAAPPPPPPPPPPPSPPPRSFPYLPLLVVGLLLAAAAAGGAYAVLRPGSVSLSVATSGRGTVTSEPVGIDCGTSCRADFREGTRVTLTATAEQGQVFAGWQGGGCSGTGPCTVTVRQDVATRAAFGVVPGPTRLLTVRALGAGTVSSTPSGIDCGRTCSASFADGARVTLSASAAKGSAFSGWQGPGCSGTATCTVTLRRDVAIEARFSTAPSTQVLTVTTSGDGGSVTSEPSGIACGKTCRGSFPDGTRVTLTASLTNDATFVGWRGACSGTGPCTVTMSQDRAVTAIFRPPRRLTIVKRLSDRKPGEPPVPTAVVRSTPGGVIDCGTTCTATFQDGSTVTLEAGSDGDYAFNEWGAKCEVDAKARNRCVVRLTEDLTIEALYIFQIR